MKSLKLLFTAAFIASVATFWSCRDESLNPVPAWETAVHGFGELVDANFNSTDINKTVKFKHLWQSNDKQNTVSKIDFYVYWDEFYVDLNGNDRRARHGGFVFSDPGKLFKTVTSPKGNRESADYSITLNEILNLYKGTKFDYKDGRGEVEVLKNPGRTDATPFTAKDVFHIRWRLTTADGRTFEIWNPDICEDVIPGLNCQMEVGVE